MTKSRLFVVATPVGNLEDVSVRVLKVLEMADLLITENQNTTRKLFRLLGLDIFGKQLITFADFNSKSILPKIITMLGKNKNSVLLAEAGTPLISDPGYEIINFIRKNSLDIKITTIPGPCSIISHLAISGLPTNSFMFVGFLPKKWGKASKVILSFRSINNVINTTFVILVSKYRLKETIALISEIYPNSLVSLGFELTKKFERVYYGTTLEVLDRVKNDRVRGESVLHLQILPNET